MKVLEMRYWRVAAKHGSFVLQNYVVYVKAVGYSSAGGWLKFYSGVGFNVNDVASVVPVEGLPATVKEVYPGVYTHTKEG